MSPLFLELIALFGLTAFFVSWDELPETLMMTGFVFLLPMAIWVMLQSNALAFDLASVAVAYGAGIGAARVKG